MTTIGSYAEIILKRCADSDYGLHIDVLTRREREAVRFLARQGLVAHGANWLDRKRYRPTAAGYAALGREAQTA